MSSLDAMPAAVIGARLRAARSAARRTQEEAANRIGVARPTLIAIEKGDRRVRMDELVQLADLFGTTCGDLLHEERPIADFSPQFRRTMGKESDEGAAAEVVRVLERLAATYTTLVRLLGVQEDVSHPPPIRLIRGQVYEQAEDAAVAARGALGIGMSPIPDLVALLETEWAFRVFVRPLPSRIAGVYAYSAELGPCVLVNALHPFTRRQVTVAHELGHFMSNREGVEVAIFDGDIDDGPAERFATRFGPAMLMPAPAVRRRFTEVLSSGSFAVRHLVFMADAFHVSPEAMCRRLEVMNLVPSGMWEMLVKRGFGAELVTEIRAGAPAPAAAPTRTTRLDLLAAEAHSRGLLSEGQLASMLDLDRVDVRELLGRFGPDTRGADVA